MPSLDEFFAEAIEQADPANMVEDEYKYVGAKLLATLTFPVGASHSSDSCCESSQGCAESKLRLAGPEAFVQEESTLFPANQSEVQEPG